MDERRGYLYGLAAYVSWGFFPIYFKHLQPSGAAEILAHRVLWSAVFIGLLLFVMRRWRSIGTLVRQPRRFGGVLLAALIIAINWGTYIYGVNTDRVVETSLGYFINPLISVLFGVLLFGERLRRGQWVALSVGGLAVGVLTVDYGRLPYIALILAVSFATYGLIKKRLALPPADGLFVESAALAVPAIVFVALLQMQGTGTVGEVSAGHTTLVLLAGVITAIPLLFFAAAANRIPMTGLGILQYTAPILQLGVGVFLYHEPMPPVRLAGFALVWVALAIFTWDALRNAARTRRAALVLEPAAA